MHKKLVIPDILQACSAKLTHSQDPVPGTFSFAGVSTDTRQNNQGKLFFALKGERYDAHDHLEAAAKSGVAGLVLSRLPSDEILQQLEGSGPLFLVPDTLKALQNLARFWRHKLGLKVVGIAGSNGKTSTKNFTATVLAGQYNTFATQGNFNNHIGVPLTLLSLTEQHEVAVVEMGMSHPGELRFLTEIADPDVCLVTNIGHEHIEFFGTLDKIAEAEEEIYRFVRPDAIRIFNLDQSWTANMATRYREKGQCLGFSSTSSGNENFIVCTLREKLATIENLIVAGKISEVASEARVPVFGRHQLHNLMAAATVGIACGMAPEKIWQQLESCRGEWGRGQIVTLGDNVKIVFDAYNANLESAEALVENVSRLSVRGKRIAIFADMLELGDLSAELHQKLGELAANAGFDSIWFYGAQREAFERGIRAGGYHRQLFVSSNYDTEIVKELAERLQNGDLVVIKGSRGMKMERILAEWHAPHFEGGHS